MFSSDKVKLRWSDHSSFFAKGLAPFLEEEAFHDVCIACCDGTTLGANRLVLSICSQFFRQTLTLCKEMRPTILLPDTSAEDMMALLEFMYRGEAYVTEERVPYLLMAARKLQINGLGVAFPPQTSIPVEPEMTPQLVASDLTDGERHSMLSTPTSTQLCSTPGLPSPQQTHSPTPVSTRSRSVKSSSQDRVECETCHRLIFSTSMYQHKRYHHGPLRDPASCCGQTFITRWDLNVHRKTSPNHNEMLPEAISSPEEPLIMNESES